MDALQKYTRTYTRLLMRVQNISWKSHPTKKHIYGDLPSIPTILKARRVQFAGHFFRAENEIIFSLLLWNTNETSSRKLRYPDVIARDIGIDINDLGTVMLDREI